MLRKVLKWLTILFQSIAIGALILYGYAMFRYRNTWEILDKGVKANISMYLTIGLISLGIFILAKIIDFILYGKYNVKKQKINNEIVNTIPNNKNITNLEVQKQEIPKEKQVICPNCGSIVDKDAYICLSCGILLNKIDELQPQIQPERIVYKEVVVKNDTYSNKNMFINAIVMVLMVLMMFVAYDYTRSNGVFFNEEMSQLEKKEYIYSLAIEVLSDFEFSISNNKVRLKKNNTYFSLSDLGYVSFEYNPTKSYVAVNERDKKYYIIMQGQGKYENYLIDLTPKSKLEINSVKVNTVPTTTPSEGKLHVDGQIFYKG